MTDRIQCSFSLRAAPRLRESQQMTLGDRQTNSANINHEQQNDMEPLSGNGTQNSDDDERSLKGTYECY